VVGAMANAAKQGTVFKGGVYLETIDAVKAIAFDKTGTLTIGRPAVTGVVTFDDLTEDELLDLAGCIESRSGHPLAAAIVRKARESGTFSGRPAVQFEEVAGRGVAATVDGQACRIGSPRAMLEQGIDIGHAEEMIARIEGEGRTVVLVSRDETLAGLVAINDEVRAGAVEALQRLRRAGVRTVMLTGDNERSAQAIAHRVGVDEYRAQLLPTDKVDAVRRLKEEYGAVAMVGDGINDAPAMAAADIGIAMGAAGTDIAIEAGDVVLMSDDLGKLAYLRELSHRTVTTIRQNIAVSLINVAFMVVAALLGYLGLVTGLLLNEASAVFVILNALRLLSWRSDAEPGVPAAAGGTAPAIPAAAEPAPVVRCCSCAEPAGGALPVPATTGSCGCSCGEPQIPVAAAEPAPVVGCCSCAEPAGGALSVPATAGSGGCSCGEPQIPVAAGTAGACCPGVEHADAVPTSAGAGCSCGEAPASIPAGTEGACYCGEAAGCCGGPAGEVVPPAPTPAGSSGLMTATFRLDGLGCACEGQMVERRMKALTGVTGFTLNPITNQLKVTYDPAAASLDDIVTAAKKVGATAVLLARG